jgi:DNA-binding NarL/FixJ family response regulator
MTATKRPFEELTIREIDLLNAYLEVYEAEKVADKLHLAIKTVHVYTQRVREKLFCDSTIQLVLEYERWVRQQS